jgi:hypothetical protein
MLPALKEGVSRDTHGVLEMKAPSMFFLEGKFVVLRTRDTVGERQYYYRLRRVRLRRRSQLTSEYSIERS